MPYIAQPIRDTIETPYVQDDAQITYAIDRMAEELLAVKCDYDWSNLSYAMIAQVVGDIECAKIEFARRILALYEDAKIVEHGDCFESAGPLGRRLAEAVVSKRTAAESVSAAEPVAS